MKYQFDIQELTNMVGEHLHKKKLIKETETYNTIWSIDGWDMSKLTVLVEVVTEPKTKEKYKAGDWKED